MAAACIGIDVAQAHLDLASTAPDLAAWRAPNTPAGIRRVVRRVTARAPPLVVLEATGGYEIPVATALAVAGVPVAVVNPRHVRDFAKALGQLAKTDQLDATVLAAFAQQVEPPPRPLPSDTGRDLRALVTRRQQLVEMRTAEQNRLETARPPLRPHLEAHIAWLHVQRGDLDPDLRQRIEASPVWRVQDQLLRSVPGVGPATATRLLGSLPALPPADRRAGRRRAAQSRQRHPPRPADHLGRPGRRAGRPLHGHPGRLPLQPRHPRLLSAAAGRRQAAEGRAHRRHAETVDHPQRDDETSDALDRPRVTRAVVDF